MAGTILALSSRCFLLGLFAVSRHAGAEETNAAPAITVASYYFGQYHPNDPRNAETKGLGWSEWELLKATNNARLHFAFMWANHDWQGNLFPYKKGEPRKIIYPSKVSPAAFRRIGDHVIKDYFLRDNHWRIDGKRIRRFQGDNGEGHQANFLKALRSRKTSDLNAPILEGHVSSAVCHLGNLSYRLGRPGDTRACQTALGNRPPVADGFPRLVQSLEGIGVDLDKTPFALGPWLELDTTTGDILKAGDGDAGHLEQARRLARGTQRAPYLFPA